MPEAEDDDRHIQSWKAVVLWEVATGWMEGLKQPLHGPDHKRINSLSATFQCF